MKNPFSSKLCRNLKNEFKNGSNDRRNEFGSI